MLATLRSSFSWSRARLWLLALASGIALFAWQPSSPIRNAQIGLPILSLILTFGVWWLTQRTTSARAANLSVVALIVLFVLLKFAPLTTALSTAWRALNGQSTAQAAASDLSWLGFSYIAFRLIHVLRDKANGRLPPLSALEFLTYVFFAPSLLAGPIDRAERFAKDLRAANAIHKDALLDGAWRVLLGAFKKFVVADALALVALNDANASQTSSTLWTWLMVYAYAGFIFFDFSGYTDMALGVARMVGIKLPENFAQPYLKPNLTQFWNSWHMSLSQWFRAYWFNPLTRALRNRGWSQALIIAVGQISTMLLIALWHGITPNFLMWGIWHAAGLFVHNRWSDFAKRRGLTLGAWSRWIGALITFDFVALGWVWFALSDFGTAWRVMLRLVGL